MSRSSKRKKPFKHLQTRLNVEALENRVTPTVNTISGFVFYDANTNGLFDPSETPIANSSIALHNSADVVVGTTTTDALGYYQFQYDQTTTPIDKTLTKTVTFPSTQTNFQLSGVLEQFDDSLGTLESVEIQHAGSITSEIQVENLSGDSTSDISGTVSGNLTLVAPGVNDNLAIAGLAGSFNAAKYDQVTDFGGTSGTSFGQKTASGSNTITVTDAASLAAYTGTGTVNVTEQGVATSNATGGGNVDVRVRSTGQSTVTVIYHYKAFGPLEPGSYKVVQTIQPTGYTDGLESKLDVVLPNTIGTDFIVVGLLDQDLPKNNFGELKPTSISGHVWHDADNDGVREANEDLIPGTTISLDSTVFGAQVTTTDAKGFYEFTNLQPGTYTLNETQPIGYLDGKDNAGTVLGVARGTVVNDPAVDHIQTITMAAGDVSENNDFGELKPASLAGHVYFDANNDGVFQATELPIAGATVTLTGFSDNAPVNIPTTTNALGEYSFTNLRPGNYTITETQPTNYADGKDTIGTPGGTPGNDIFSAIQLDAGVDGVNNDFGEIQGNTPLPPTPLPKGVGPLGELPVISKVQLTAIPEPVAINPILRAEMAFVVGSTITLTGQQLNAANTLIGVGQLQSGVSQTGFVQNLWASDAHRALQAESLYQDVLNRAPTVAEKAATIATLRAGTTEMAVKEDLFVSAEYGALHPGTDGLAQGLYADILNTVPGTQELQAFTLAMANDPLRDVVHALLTSDDALGSQIDDAYRLTLRRAATASEIQTWTAPVKAGTITLDELAQRLLASQEFYQLAFNNIH